MVCQPIQNSLRQEYYEQRIADKDYSYNNQRPNLLTAQSFCPNILAKYHVHAFRDAKLLERLLYFLTF